MTRLYSDEQSSEEEIPSPPKGWKREVTYFVVACVYFNWLGPWAYLKDLVYRWRHL